jgi:hypothetical protein
MQANGRVAIGQTNRLAVEPVGASAAVPFSRPLDVHRWSDYPELANCLDQLVAEIEAWEERQRRRTDSAARRLREAIRCLVLDLYVADRLTPDCEIGVSLAKGAFQPGSRYAAIFLTYDTFKAAFGGLEALGYLAITRKGFHDPVTGIGRTTRVRATGKLVHMLLHQGRLSAAAVGFRDGADGEEVIVLRDDQKRAIVYDDDTQTRAMRADLQRINGRLVQAWIDLYLPDEDLAALNALMRTDHAARRREAPFVDFGAKRMRRIFNNGDWSQGGRFYDGWWQTVPRDYRRYITINGKPTVEIDFSGLHPAMMYAEVGSALEDDPYEIGVPTVSRDIVKRTFNKLINAERRMKPTQGFDPSMHGLEWRELVEAIRRKHGPIARFFNTGHGLRLQNRDATIANRVMLRFVAMGYICLPVHDSFIVHHALRDELADTMADEFRKEVGGAIASKVKRGFLASYEPEYTGSIPTDTIMSDVMEGRGKYAGYQSRELEWLAANQAPG